MTRLRHLVFAALALVTLAPAAHARPNVLLFLVDDLGWRDLGVTGSTFYQTPHVDRLFASGAHFTRNYASCQVCSPTRASLLTGKAPPRHGITEWIGAEAGETWDKNTPLLPAEYAHALPHADTTLAEALGAAGYRTFFAGKWHLGGEGSLPTDHGFDVNRGGYESGGPAGGYFSPYKNPHLPDGPPGEHLPIRLAKETAAFVRQPSEQPFFAMLSFYSVHSALQTSRERWRANRLEALAGPAPAARFAFDRTMPVRVVQDHPVYAGMVEAMDDAVGLVLAALDDAGLRNDTIVVFTSDNGGVSSGDGRATSNRPLRGGKGTQWEGGLRVPLAIAWPGRIEAGREIAAPAITTDLYPTLLELCGLPAAPEQHVDGVSLTPALEGGELAKRSLFWHYPHYSNQGGAPSSVILQGDAKLIRYHEDGHEELYALTSDAAEWRDLADERGDRVAVLGEELDLWLDETGAVAPTPNPAFDANRAAADRRQMRTETLRLEERFARGVLQEHWAPNPTWWGSQPLE